MGTRAVATIVFQSATPQFTVPDVVRTAEYYRDVFGFEIRSYWDGARVSFKAEPPPVFGIVRRDHVQVFFSRADQSAVRTGRAEGACDVYINVAGVDALAAQLRNAWSGYPRRPGGPGLHTARTRCQGLQWLGIGVR